MLCEAARRLQATLGEDAVVARLSGDEYAVLCPRTSGAAGALETATEIQESLESPMRVGGAALNVEASLGVVGAAAQR